MRDSNGISTLIIAVVAGIAIIGGVAGYAMIQPSGGNGGTTETPVSLNLSGSSTVYPLALEWAAQYMELHPNWTINVSGGGSVKGVSDASQNLVDIGMASRPVKSSELEENPDLVQHEICYDGVVVIVNSSHPDVSDLTTNGITKTELIGIYDGTITDWQTITGNSQQLTSYNRAEASGTKETFAGFVDIDEEELHGVGVQGNQGMKTAIIADTNGIGYVGAAFAFEDVQAVPIDGDDSGTIDSTETVDSFSDLKSHITDYPISRSLYYVTNGTPNTNAQTFIDWCLGDGQQYVESVGYIAL